MSAAGSDIPAHVQMSRRVCRGSWRIDSIRKPRAVTSAFILGRQGSRLTNGSALVLGLGLSTSSGLPRQQDVFAEAPTDPLRNKLGLTCLAMAFRWWKGGRSTTDSVAENVRPDGAPAAADIGPAPTELDLVFRHVGTVLSPTADAELLAISLGYDDQPISLWSSGGVRVVRLGTSDDHHFELSLPGVRSPLIQKLPGDRVLVCDARTRGQERNAWIFSDKGDLLAAGTLHDGIAHVLATASGAIWVGYFDEGVYGGSTVARHGIVRFNDSLEPQWQYPLNGPFGSISDCYSLNLAEDVAWSCYYQGFPIVRIHGNEVDGWQGGPSGSNDLLVRGAEVLYICAPNWGDHQTRVFRLALGSDGVATVLSEGRAFGIPVSTPHVRICRGPDAHLFVGPEWFRATMSGDSPPTADRATRTGRRRQPR